MSQIGVFLAANLVVKNKSPYFKQSLRPDSYAKNLLNSDCYYFKQLPLF